VRLLWACIFAAASLEAQVPRVGAIEFYGLHRVSRQKLLHALRVSPGGPLPPSKGNLEDRLEKVPGVVLAHVEAVCCEAGQTILFVGIEERGAPHLEFHTPPSGQAALPQDISDTYDKFVEAVRAAAERGSTAEDLTHGHSLMADPDARELQQSFAAFAEKNVPLLRKVLRESGDADQRAVAAAIIGYAPNKAAVVRDLEYAMQDPAEPVRANALRALNAIAVLARLQPHLGIRVSPTWFVEMLNSIELSDRRRAATALVSLTDQDASTALDEIRQRARGAVLEMAQWKELSYALPAFILAGRMAGMKEDAIQEAWTKGDRQAVIDRAREDGRRQ
jgi:hypothetical protein